MAGTLRRKSFRRSWVWLLVASYLLLNVMLMQFATVADPAPAQEWLLTAGLCIAAVVLAITSGRGETAGRLVWFWCVVLFAAMLLASHSFAVVRFAQRSPRDFPRHVRDEAADERIRRLHVIQEQMTSEADTQQIDSSNQR